MNSDTTTQLEPFTVPAEVIQDFAGARGRVQNAVKAARRSISFAEALKQVQSISEQSRTNSSHRK